MYLMISFFVRSYYFLMLVFSCFAAFFAITDSVTDDFFETSFWLLVSFVCFFQYRHLSLWLHNFEIEMARIEEIQKANKINGDSEKQEHEDEP